MYIEIDGKRLDEQNTQNMQQQLDMQHAAFTAPLVGMPQTRPDDDITFKLWREGK